MRMDKPSSYRTPGQTVTHSNVYYLGTVKVNLVGFWMKGFPTDVDHHHIGTQTRIGDLSPTHEIEETFRDCKDLLRLTR